MDFEDCTNSKLRRSLSSHTQFLSSRFLFCSSVSRFSASTHKSAILAGQAGSLGFGQPIFLWYRPISDFHFLRSQSWLKVDRLIPCPTFSYAQYSIPLERALWPLISRWFTLESQNLEFFFSRFIMGGRSRHGSWIGQGSFGAARCFLTSLQANPAGRPSLTREP